MPPEIVEPTSQTVSAIIDAARDGHWAIVAGLGLMVVIWVLRRINILARVPKKFIPLVSAALGVVGYIAVGLAQGLPWYVALQQGFLTGASAGFSWELIFKHLLKKPKENGE